VNEGSEQDFQIVKKIVKSGECVVDIGANIGIYTAFLARLVGGGGRVFSIEPVALTFGFLKNNVRKTKMNNVVLLNYAISEFDGETSIEIPKYETGGGNYYQAKIVQDNFQKLKRGEVVQTKRLDNLLGDTDERISFIKCDVEGHELECVKGAIGIIKKCHPSWLIEVSDNPDKGDSKAFRMVGLLESEGYKCFWFDGRVLRRRGRGDASVNYFFLTPVHLRKLNEDKSVNLR